MPDIPTMPLDQVRALPEFVSLTSKQRHAVEVYLQTGGDRVAATMAAYSSPDKERARILSYTVFGAPGVIAVLNAAYGVTPCEAFRRDVARAIRNKKLTMAAVRSMELQARVLGVGTENLPASHSALPVESETVKPEQAPAPAGPTWPIRFQMEGIAYQMDFDRDTSSYSVTEFTTSGDVKSVTTAKPLDPPKPQHRVGELVRANGVVRCVTEIGPLGEIAASVAVVDSGDVRVEVEPKPEKTESQPEAIPRWKQQYGF